MISYAQNHEDVVLSRAFKHPRGFYVDIGAASPVSHSVTKHFYDRGWHGINVEPVARWQAELRVQRPRDVNLAVGVGDAPGMLELFDVSELDKYAGESTFSGEIADSLRARGVDPKPTTVEVTTLAAICEEHVDGEIEFLKIDVEGFELEVLRGGDWDQFRPIAVVVESVFPRTSIARIEMVPFMESKGYHETLFDGQNRFYVRDESPEVMEALSVPANVTDDYEPAELVDLRQALEAMAASRDDTEQQRLRLESELRRLGRDAEALREHVQRLEERVELGQQELVRSRRAATDAEIQFKATREALDALISNGSPPS